MHSTSRSAVQRSAGECLTMAGGGGPCGCVVQHCLGSHIPLQAGNGAWSKSARWPHGEIWAIASIDTNKPLDVPSTHIWVRGARRVCCSRLGVCAVMVRQWLQSKFGLRSSIACWLDTETSEHTLHLARETGVHAHAVLPRLFLCC